MLMKMAPSSRRNSRSNYSRGYIVVSQLSCRLRSSDSLPTIDVNELYLLMVENGAFPDPVERGHQPALSPATIVAIGSISLPGVFPNRTKPNLS